MSTFFSYDLEGLEENGVELKFKCVRMQKMSDGNIRAIRVFNADFSEHDKVFEDKIAELEHIINHKLGDWNKHGITYQEIMDMKAENQELKQITKGYEDKIVKLKKDYKTASELLGKYQQENEGLKKRIIELENFSCQAEQETESLVEKLKQRIVELESKETENVNEMPDSITIDGYKCKIIKTESGLYISRDEIYSIIDKEKEPLKQKCKELEDKHQSDCIEINRLNTTIDVLIHKVEYLRQFAGLE